MQNVRVSKYLIPQGQISKYIKYQYMNKDELMKFMINKKYLKKAFKGEEEWIKIIVNQYHRKDYNVVVLRGIGKKCLNIPTLTLMEILGIKYKRKRNEQGKN